MKTFTTALALAAALGLTTSAFANTPKEVPAMQEAKAPTMQQGKMATCNQEAGDSKGAERKAMMKECLSAKKEGGTQQNRMKTCNADATGKSGAERKEFMKECLSNKA